MRRLALVLLLFACVLPAGAADGGFKAVVKAVERQYGIRRMHPHLLGFTMFLAKPAMWGSGVHGMKLAVFEDETRDFTASAADLDRMVAEAMGPKWQPFVRVQSRMDGESSVIYTSFAGKHMRMLIASVERGEMSVIQMTISAKSIRQWMDDPGGKAKKENKGQETGAKPGNRSQETGDR